VGIAGIVARGKSEATRFFVAPVAQLFAPKVSIRRRDAVSEKRRNNCRERIGPDVGSIVRLIIDSGIVVGKRE